VGEPVDFVAIGHVTIDETSSGQRPGGAAYYAALTAHRLGLRTGLLTSLGPDVPPGALPADVHVANVASDRSTVFALEAGDRGSRQLRLLSRAADIEAEHLPDGWDDAALVMLCPVINEVDPALAVGIPDASVGVLAQGFLRERGAGGVIGSSPWEDAGLVLPHAQLVVVSGEDIEGMEKTALEWFQRVPLGAVTHGRRGATLFVNGERYAVEPDPAHEVDATGAGDVFGAALLLEYYRSGNPWDAAAAAACCAAASVEAQGAAGIPDRAALGARLAAYQRRISG